MLPRSVKFCISRFAPLIVLQGTLSLFAPSVSAERIGIIVAADADEDYVKHSESLEYQTYHFVEGQYFGGTTRDKGMETMGFIDIAKSLATALEKRKFYPEPDPHLGDLLIMISWGRTDRNFDLRETLGIDSQNDMLSDSAKDRIGSNDMPTDAMAKAIFNHEALSSAAESMFKTRFSKSKTSAFALLGLERGIEDVYGKDLAEEALDTERYFVVVNAFDYQHLLKEKELKQVWFVKYNCRAIGVGFENAINTMNRAVSGTFGVKLDKLVKFRGDTEGSAELGEVEVVGTEEEPDSSDK